MKTIPLRTVRLRRAAGGMGPTKLLYWWLYIHGLIIRQAARRVGGTIVLAVVQIALVALMVASEAPERLPLVAIYNVGAWAIIITGIGMGKFLAWLARQRQPIRNR